jgi:hypothetical protein
MKDTILERTAGIMSVRDVLATGCVRELRDAVSTWGSHYSMIEHSNIPTHFSTS